MKWDEVEFRLRDMKTSFYEGDITSEMSNLQERDTLQVEIKGKIHDCWIKKRQWGDYNIRGHLLVFELEYD